MNQLEVLIGVIGCVLCLCGCPAPVSLQPPDVGTSHGTSDVTLSDMAHVAIDDHDSHMVYQQPAPARIRFTVLPDDPEFRQSVIHTVELVIADANNVLVRTVDLGEEMGLRIAEWDGRQYDPNGPWAPPGLYTATINMHVGSIVLSDSCTIRIGQPALTMNLQDEGGLDESTLVFNLNGTIIDHSRLILERTIVTDHGIEFLKSLRVKYRPPVSELILPGENTLRVDITDLAGNRMDQLVYPFNILP